MCRFSLIRIKQYMSSLTPSPGAAPRWQFWHFGALGGAEGGSFGPGPAARAVLAFWRLGGGQRGQFWQGGRRSSHIRPWVPARLPGPAPARLPGAGAHKAPGAGALSENAFSDNAFSDNAFSDNTFSDKAPSDKAPFDNAFSDNDSN